MDVNPYKSPHDSRKDDSEPRAAGWHPLTFAFLGFAIGTAVASQFILSRDPFDRCLGGAFYGGTIGAILGLAHGLRRSRIAESPRREVSAENECAAPLRANSNEPRDV